MKCRGLVDGVLAKAVVDCFLCAVAFLLLAWFSVAEAQVSNGASTGAAESRNDLGANGTDNITSAFGMTLGDYFDPKTASGRTSLKNGKPIYGFAPTTAYRAFSRYYVMITPVTNRVYGILAVGTFGNTQEEVAEKRDLMNLLKSKYGDDFEDRSVEGLRHAEQLRRGSRYILVNKSRSIETSVDIRDYDLALRNLAEQEAKSLPHERGGKGSL